MKSIQNLAAVVITTCLACCGALAQTNVLNSTSGTERDGKVLLPERTTSTDSANATTANLRPTRPERPNLPPEVQTLLERYKAEARAYLNKQEELKKKLQGANDKERALIRAQIRDLQQQWSQQAKALRKEFKDRQAELAQKLPSYRELLDSARSTGTVPASGDRTRRGED